jgi:hypothetical protein
MIDFIVINSFSEKFIFKATKRTQAERKPAKHLL